jgi:hypothetical protein
MPKRTDYKYSLVRAVVSLRADAAPHKKGMAEYNKDIILL